MPRPRLTPGEEPKRLRIKIPQSLWACIAEQMEEAGEDNKSKFIRERLHAIFATPSASDTLELYKKACKDLIWLFNNFLDDPTVEGLDLLLDQLDTTYIDKAKRLLENE